MKAQYNFKVEEELKEKLDKQQEELGINSKEEFLQELFIALENQKLLKADTELDLSHYDVIDKTLKENLLNTFKNILKNIDAHTSNIKSKEISFKEELESSKIKDQARLKSIDTIKDEFIEKLNNMGKEHSQVINEKDTYITELEDKLKKFENLELVEEMARTVMIANTELMDRIEQLEKERFENIGVNVND